MQMLGTQGIWDEGKVEMEEGGRGRRRRRRMRRRRIGLKRRWGAQGTDYLPAWGRTQVKRHH